MGRDYASSREWEKWPWDGATVNVKYLDREYDQFGNASGSGQIMHFKGILIQKHWWNKKLWMISVKHPNGTVLMLSPKVLTNETPMQVFIGGYIQDFSDNKKPTCTCPAWKFNVTRPCKHIRKAGWSNG